MQHVLDGMTPPKKAEKKKKAAVKESVWEYAPKLDYDSFRDYYMLDHIFKVGALVEHDDSGLRGTVVHRGTNYIIMQLLTVQRTVHGCNMSLRYTTKTTKAITLRTMVAATIGKSELINTVWQSKT